MNKKDLEEKGWEQNKLPYQFLRKNNLLYVSRGDNYEIISENEELVITDQRYQETIFRGKIPTLKDFNYICKLLNI